MTDMNEVVGRMNVLFITLDCLRFDVARACLDRGRTPNLARVLPPGGWEARETPGTFTLPAHLAFFHGFLPTPLTPGPHPRLFALEFEGSLSTAPTTFVFRGVPDVISGFHALAYRSFCVGGVGFFNKKNALGHVLPGFFQQSVWSPALSVTAKDSTAAQVRAAIEWLEEGIVAAALPVCRGSLGRPGGLPPRGDPLALLFLNVSATHPPHAHYLPGATGDCAESQMAALEYVDSCLPPLFAALKRRGDWFCLVMADHGEAHGEDGRYGHRLAHPTVTTVPYAHFVLA